MLTVIRFLGGVALVWAWFAVMSAVVLVLSGCGYFVADNPACLENCSSHYQGPTGGAS